MGRLEREKFGVDQKAPLDVWAEYGADQHEVCLWYLGSRIQASNGLRE